MMEGLVYNIQRFSIQDGPGIRTTVFLKGCPLDCWWCHNPESQDAAPQVMVAQDRCIRCGECRKACPQGLAGECGRCGRCADACPTGARRMVGRRMTVEQVLEEIGQDRVFYDESAGGVTVSGGEPLAQCEFVIELLRGCRREGIHTALDTCGFAPQARLLEAACLADLVLYDVKLVDEARHIRYTGVSNRAILENLQALAAVHGNIWVRVPIIPGLTDDAANLDAVRELVGRLRVVRKVCLLPYHATGEGKFRQLGRPYRVGAVRAPSSQVVEAIARRFRELGLDAKVGG